MSNLFRLAAYGSLALASASIAQAAPQQAYGDTLAARTLSRYKGVTAVRIEAVGKDQRTIIIARGGTVYRSVPLRNSLGEPIGSVSAGFARKLAPAMQERILAALAADLSRQIYVADNLVEKDPFVAGARRSAYAQGIVERMMKANPDLVTLAFHVGATGASNTILASNFGRIGKAGDADDAEVIDRGTTRREVTNGGRRAAIELPLLDRNGRTVGALSTSFLVGAGGPDAASRRAIEVRDEIAREIHSLAQISR